MRYKTFKWAERRFFGQTIDLTPPRPPDDLVDLLGVDLAIGWAGVMARAQRPLPRSTIGFYMGLAEPRDYGKATAQMGKVWRLATTRLKRVAVLPDEWLSWVSKMTDEFTAFDLLIRRPQRRRRIVAVAGPPGVGKSKVAEWIAERTGGTIIRFSDAARRYADGLSYLDGRPKECQRHILDTITMTVREFYSEDFLLLGFAKMYEDKILKGRDWLIVDDLRYWNEHLWVQALSGTTIRVKRSGVDYPQSFINPFREGYDYHKNVKKFGRRWIYGEVENPGYDGGLFANLKRMLKYFIEHHSVIDPSDIGPYGGWHRIKGLRTNDVKRMVELAEELDRS